MPRLTSEIQKLVDLIVQRRNPSNTYLLGILVALVGIFTLLLPGKFFRIANLESIAFQVPELGILSMAMMVTLLSGGLNLAIVATANMAGIAAAAILTHFIPEGASGALPVLVMSVAMLVALSTALLVGLLNGWIIAYLGVSPILTTLGTMTLIEGMNVSLTKGYVISGFPEPILFIGNGLVLGIPTPMLVFAGCAFLVALLLRWTPFGVAVYMMGSSERATLFSGIHVRKVQLKIYALSGFLCGVAALVMISRFNSAKAGYASSYLLVTILAAVLGGVDPFGGFGKVMGLVLALLILQVISSGLNLLGMSGHLPIAVWGGILIFILFLNQVRAWLGRARA
jgi:ribose/xylose/arabinose/galactoside ABC-type transport system permease subunit